MATQCQIPIYRTIRRGAHCASDNRQELVVVKNVSIFGEISSFSVVFVFMPFRHEPDAQWRLLKKSLSQKIYPQTRHISNFL